MVGRILKILLAIFLPPAAAFWQVGIGLHFWLNILFNTTWMASRRYSRPVAYTG